MINIRFGSSGSKLVYSAIFLIGFPLLGALLGYVFFSVLNFITGPYSVIALRLTVVLWAVVGLAFGIYAFWTFRRHDRALEREQRRRE